MLHHSGLLTGGWLGVDVFFALSGFLITSLLVEERERTGGIALARFYARRALRLLPALVAMVAVCGLAVLLTSPRALVAGRAAFLAAVLLYAANWAILAGYLVFALGHTWSLAIEEQFYVLWPPMLALLLRGVRGRSAAAGAVVLVGFGAAVAWRTALAAGGADSARLFVGLDTRCDSLLLGCLLALVMAPGRWATAPAVAAAARWIGAGAAAGLCALFAVARYPEDLRAHFATTLAALAAALVIAAALAPGSLVGRALATRPLVATGKVSYGLYLWHLPIFMAVGVPVGEAAPIPPGRLVLGWVLSIAVCALSFALIERPALRLKARLRSLSS